MTMKTAVKTKKKSGMSLALAPYSAWSFLFILVPLFFVAYYAFTDNNFALDNQSSGLPLRSGALWMAQRASVISNVSTLNRRLTLPSNSVALRYASAMHSSPLMRRTILEYAPCLIIFISMLLFSHPLKDCCAYYNSNKFSFASIPQKTQLFRKKSPMPMI